LAVETLIRQLLEAGVHFGHQTKRWNPKMKKFIFGERSGIYIIDLQQTAQRLKAACEFLKDLASKGKFALFVGTKKQAKEVVGFEGSRCGMFYVNERWLGGTLTNFETVRKSVKRLHEMEALRAPESSAALSKKERSTLDKEIARLTKKLSGIVQMKNLPSVLIVVDPKKEENAVAEARRLDIPVIALLDTNCDPEDIDFPIPGNDDALKSIKFVVSLLADNVLTGREKHLQVKKPKKQPKEQEEVTEQAPQEPLNADEQVIVENVEKKLKEPEEPHKKRQPKE